jgi:hypothetical protein
VVVINSVVDVAESWVMEDAALPCPVTTKAFVMLRVLVMKQSADGKTMVEPALAPSRMAWIADSRSVTPSQVTVSATLNVPREASAGDTAQMAKRTSMTRSTFIVPSRGPLASGARGPSP